MYYRRRSQGLGQLKYTGTDSSVIQVKFPLGFGSFPEALVLKQAIISGKTGILGFTRIPASGAVRGELS